MTKISSYPDPLMAILGPTSTQKFWTITTCPHISVMGGGMEYSRLSEVNKYFQFRSEGCQGGECILGRLVSKVHNNVLFGIIFF